MGTRDEVEFLRAIVATQNDIAAADLDVASVRCSGRALSRRPPGAGRSSARADFGAKELGIPF
jgi:hypothetical protein